MLANEGETVMTTGTGTGQTADIAERQRFIEALELPPIEESFRALSHAAVRPRADEKEGFVDDGSLVSFVSEVSQQAREDVLNSTLLAQLAANKQFDRWKNTTDWYKHYVLVLGKVGWVLQNFNFSEHNAHGASFEVDKVVLAILAAVASQNQILIVAETMAALKALGEKDGRVVLFENASSSLGSGNFQISAVNETNGAVAMGIGAFHFSSTQTTTRFLWFKYDSSKSHLFKGAQVGTLNEQVYKVVRQSVLDKLGDSAKTFVDDIPI
jgi:hypothetical protein